MTQFKEYKIEVKNWMMQKSSGDFDWMQHWNNDIPMPLKIMYGVKLGETKGMVKMRLHGDLKDRITPRCMCCGKPIPNKISQYFGMGPICGEHNYTNPFETTEELDAAIATYREKLVNIVWEGMIAKSAIVAIDDDPDIYTKLAEMPTVKEAPSTSDKKEEATQQTPQFVINAKIAKPNKLTDDYSVFLSFKYNEEAKNAIKALPSRAWDNDNKVWEIEYREFEDLKSVLPNFTFEISGEEILPTKVEFNNAFHYKTAPMQHQVDGIRYGFNHNRFLLADDQGLGKALALDTKLYTPTGYTLMRDIQVGDYVLGRDGKPTQVTAVYDHHNVDMYRFTFSDGVSIDCCKDHLWQIYDQGTPKVVPTSWFLEKNHIGTLRKDALRNKTNYNYWIPTCDAVEFNPQSVPLHPYVLGCLLGDGCITINNLSLSSPDIELVEKVNSLLPKDYVLNSSPSMSDIDYNIICTNYAPGRHTNIVKHTLKQLKLYGCTSHTKFIPDQYKYNSSDVRLAILQGLLDTDGYATRQNLVQFTSVSKQLALDVQFLVESLGGMAVFSEGPCGYNGKITGTQYTLTIRVDDPSILFTLSRKKSLLKPRHFKPHRNIVKIERIANADARCITVDNSESLYLVDHFVVTHNTKQIIDLAVMRKQIHGFKHCLIVCGVNSLKWNWLEEISKHSNESGWILGQYEMKRSHKITVGGNSAKLDDLNKLGNDAELDSHYFIITNIESLRDEEISGKLKDLCEAETINMVAIDEIHRAKNLRTKQGEGMLQLQPTYRIAMTGTPLMNSPLDLFAILKWLGYQRYGFVSFRDHFCNLDDYGNVISYKNIDQLKAQLDSIMIRRTKDEVLDLPEKTYINEYVEMTDEQKRLYNQVIDDAIADPELAEQISTDCMLAIKLRLRQVSGGIGPFNFIKKNPKLDRLEQLVEEAVYSGTKVIIYSNWVEGLRPALERLQKYNPVVITGETNDSDRQILVNKFQNDDTCKIAIGTIGAMGTGLTLVAATEVIFLDEPWTNAAKEQACDRAHRIGTTSKVTIHTIIAHNTYDEDVHAIVKGKRDLSKMIVEKKDLLKLKIS